MKFDVVGLASGLMTAMLVDLSADASFSIPSRQYLAAGPEIAFDCEELVVHATEITSLPLFGGIVTDVIGDDVRFFVNFMVTVVRCVPLPADENSMVVAADLDTSGRAALGDGGSLLRAAVSAWQRKALLPGCSDVTIGPLAWATPEGGLIGTTLNIKCQL